MRKDWKGQKNRGPMKRGEERGLYLPSGRVGRVSQRPRGRHGVVGSSSRRLSRLPIVVQSVLSHALNGIRWTAPAPATSPSPP